MKDANKIVELLRELPNENVLQASILRTLKGGTGMDALNTIADLQDMDNQYPEGVRKALGAKYEQIKSLWQ